MGANWSNLGIVFRFRTGYNLIKKTKNSKIPKYLSKNVEKSLDISDFLEYTNRRTSVRLFKVREGDSYDKQGNGTFEYDS